MTLKPKIFKHAHPYLTQLWNFFTAAFSKKLCGCFTKFQTRTLAKKSF